MDRLIVKKRIREYAERYDISGTGDDPEYCDLMNNIEGQVQTVLAEEGYLPEGFE